MSDHIILLLDDLTPVPPSQSSQPTHLASPRTESLVSDQETFTSNGRCSPSLSPQSSRSSQHKFPPPPEARTRLYFGQNRCSITDAFEEDADLDQKDLVTFTTHQQVQPAVVITSTTMYTKFTIPRCTKHRSTFYDMVLGMSTRHLNLEVIEAIVITFSCGSSSKDSTRSEVITCKELERLTGNRIIDTELLQDLEIGITEKKQHQGQQATNDDGIRKFKLHKKLFLSTSPLDVVIEVRTWDVKAGYGNDGDGDHGGVGSSKLLDYGSLALHFVEILTDAQGYYSQDPMYEEHQPFVHFVDMNKSGCRELDSAAEYPQVVTHYGVSRDGSHVVVATVAGPDSEEDEDNDDSDDDDEDDTWMRKSRFLQVWNFRDPTTAATTATAISSKKDTSLCQDDVFQPQLVAWMQLPTIRRWNSELSLSYDGSQLAILDLVPFGLTNDDERKEYRSSTVFYRCDVGHTEVPEGAVAGFGLKRCRVEETHTRLTDFCGRGQFHTVESSNPDIMDELFVAFDGVSIEVYSVYYETWRHVRSILVNPARNGPEFVEDVYRALSDLLRGSFLVIKEPGKDQAATTWNIEQGTRMSSFAGLSLEQDHSIVNSSAMSKDGKMIAIPGSHHLDLFWTESWTLAGTCAFPWAKLSSVRIESVIFIRGDKEILVSVGVGGCSDEEALFHRRNQGYIVNAETMRVTERVISEGSDVFLVSNGGDEGGSGTQAFSIEDSQVSLFNLEDRIVRSPTKVRERLCDDSCTSKSSFKSKHGGDGGKKGAMSLLSGMRFMAEELITAVVMNGRRERMSFVMATACDKNGSIVQRMLVPLPMAMVSRNVSFVGGKEGCSFLLVELDKLIMIWSTPSLSTLQGEFLLQLVQEVDYDVKWTICPHNQLSGWMTPGPTSEKYIKNKFENCLVDTRYLYDPTKTDEQDISFLNGVQELVGIFEFASPPVRRDILRYVGKYVNRSVQHSDRYYNVVSYLCQCWNSARHEALLLFFRGLLLEEEDMPRRWIPTLLDIHGRNGGEGNPILCLVNKARTQPKAMEVAEVLVEHLVRQAKVEKDPYYLALIMQSLPELMAHPSKGKDKGSNEKIPPQGAEEFVAQFYRHLAYLPARPIRLPPGATDQEQEQEWSGIRAGLALRKDLVTKELYFASFDMLWYNIESTAAGGGGQASTSGSVRDFLRMGMLWSVSGQKLKLSLKDTVRCYPLVVMEYKNPAIAALVDYKWSNIGFAYWRNQFIARCCYYLIVLLSVMLQIWGKSKAGTEGYIVYAWAGMFFDILITSFIFLCVEVVQIFRQGAAYFRSIFNILDFLVLALPLAGSINQICILLGVLSPPGQHSGFLSFSVLVVLLHFVVELRVFKGVARVVSSVFRGIESIAVFLIVYMLGVLGFLMAFMHMIPACLDAASCQDLSSSLDSAASSDFIAAVSATQLSGRNGLSKAWFYSDNWANFLLAFAFFLFTAMMFINMAVVLLQSAIKEGAEELWLQDWFKDRLKFVESAENMSYRSAVARKNEKKFPDVLYYSATIKEIREYEMEVGRLRREAITVESTADSQRRRKEVAKVGERVVRQAVAKVARR
ncbi:MAG: hypothetical protein J3R72DRAFT_93181 [Linnemannia gamsii]|nr:MAG: hypothetical protein J3R72DRAFT_93181 [Linnemannia gamsii]